MSLPDLMISHEFLKVHDRDIFIKRIKPAACIGALLFVHGSVEDGRIFYSDSGKGLAPFLASQGFDCFIPDFGGRGKSLPVVSRHSQYGHEKFITEDLPAMIAYVKRISGFDKLQIINHSWGGVMMLSYLARYDCNSIPSMVMFGVKRRITVRNFRKIMAVNMWWAGLGNLLVKRHGYLPARKWKMGAEDEPAQLFKDINKWIKADGKWIGNDGFDYSSNILKKPVPPILYYAAIQDPYLGNETDVRLLAEETGAKNYRFCLLSKANGNLQDYDHINMLTSPSAPKDHFVKVAEWLQSHLQELSAS